MEGFTLLVKVNPLQLRASEISVAPGQEPTLREFDVDEHIFEDLQSDGFMEASPLEFNLYSSGLVR